MKPKIKITTIHYLYMMVSFATVAGFLIIADKVLSDLAVRYLSTLFATLTVLTLILTWYFIIIENNKGS